jgi:hypothetical protein
MAESLYDMVYSMASATRMHRKGHVEQKWQGRAGPHFLQKTHGQ